MGSAAPLQAASGGCLHRTPGTSQSFLPGFDGGPLGRFAVGSIARFERQKPSHFDRVLRGLQQASGPAVTTLLKILVDPNAQLAVKARCAYYILDQTRKGMETEEIEVRVPELERAAEASKQAP
jgi:hypothetical protein